MVKLPDATILGARPSPRVAERTPDTRVLRAGLAQLADTTGGVETAAFAEGAAKLADVTMRAGERIRRRRDTIELAKAETAFTSQADTELRRLQDEDDLSDPAVGQSYLDGLRKHRDDLLGSFKGSADALAALDARLTGEHGKYADAAGRAGVEIGKRHIERNISEFTGQIVSGVLSDPSSFRGALDAAEAHIDRFSAGLSVEEEIQIRADVQRQVAAAAFESMLNRDDIEGARELIEDTPGLEKVLSPAQRISAANRVADAYKARSAGVLGGQKKLDELRTLLGREPTMAERMKVAGVAGVGGDLSGFSTDVRSVRQEFNRASDEFIDVKSRYQRIQVTQDSPAGDLSLIFAYMKMLDPGSVVREGEQATARNAAAIPDRIRNLYNRVMSGEPLTPEQRTDFRSQAAALLKPEIRNQIDRETHYRDLASRAGLNPDDVVLDHIGELRGGASTESSPVPGVPARPRQGGKTKAAPVSEPAAAPVFEYGLDGKRIR